MMPCSQIVIEAGGVGQAGGKLTTIHSTITGCDKWYGVVINGVSTKTRSSSRHGEFESSDGLEISDAFKAFYSDNGGRLRVIGADFENNENDITLQDYTSDNYEPEISGNEFKGKWMRNNFGDLSCTSYQAYQSPINGSPEKNMIYLENVKDLDIYGCTFNGNDFLDGGNNHVTNGIEIYDAENVNLGRQIFGAGNDPLVFTGYLNTGITARYLNNVVNNTPYYDQDDNYMFDKYYFDEDVVLYKAIVLDHCSTIVLGYVQASPYDANRFLGYMDYATYVTNCYDITQYENLFNVSNVGSTTGSGSYIGQGGYYSACDELDIVSNWMSSIPAGAEFQSCTNSTVQFNQVHDLLDGFFFKDCDEFTIQGNTFEDISSYSMQYYGYGGSAGTIISENRFLDNSFGLIISPVENPISASTTANTGNTTLMNIDITCNYFNNNDYAIVGSRKLKTQGSSGNAASNKFVSSVYADLLWEYHATSFNYYRDALTPQSDPNIVNGVSSTLYLNSYSNPFNVNPIQTGLKGCFSGLSSPSNSVGILTKTQEKSIALNNPVSNSLKISRSNLDNEITCFDELGKLHKLSVTSSSYDSSTFDTSGLAPGMYFIRLDDLTLKFIKIN